MKPMPYLAIKHYWRFQHYHTRGAPWIKLYADVLDDLSFVRLPEAAQAQLMKLWVLAARVGHPLPNDPKLLAGKIAAPGRFYLTDLIDAGFLVPCATLADAEAISGKPHGKSEQNASIAASTNAGESLAESLPYARADARSRESGERRAESSEGRTQTASAVRSDGSNRRSGDLDQERGGASAAAAAPPADAGDRELPREAEQLLDRSYPDAAVRERKRHELLRTLTTGVKYRGHLVLAASPRRLAGKCQEVLDNPPRDPSKALAVLLAKLNDTSDITTAAVKAEHQEIAGEERNRGRELVEANAWLEEHPDAEQAIAEQLARDFPQPVEPGDDILAISRRIAREALVLDAWRHAGSPELARSP